MQCELFTIKALLEIIFRVTTISANRFAQKYLLKDPAVIARWKTGRKIPSLEDLSIIASVASKEATENQKVQIRNEIEDLMMHSTLSEEFKKVILGKIDFKEFLIEALSTSVIKASKPQSPTYQEQVSSEILENIAYIDSRLYLLNTHKFYDEECCQIELSVADTFTDEINKLQLKTEFKDKCAYLEKESRLNSEYIRPFYDEVTELSGQYNSFSEFLIAAANDNKNRKETIRCYICFLKSSIDIIRCSTNIAYVTGLLALYSIGKSPKLTLKSISLIDTEDTSDRFGMLMNSFTSHTEEYSKLVDEKTVLLKRMKTIEN